MTKNTRPELSSSLVYESLKGDNLSIKEPTSSVEGSDIWVMLLNTKGIVSANAANSS